MSFPRAYYNEIDPFAAAWLRNLMGRGLIMEGKVDERSIEEVRPEDLEGFTRCHFFAGIGGWDLALRWGGWSPRVPVWTGSCPCQPLSSAGLQQGAADERHLWPAFYALIAECGPPVVFGEQVASPLGREWLAAVRLDLESLGYAVGAADLPAAGIGAPHIRQRLWWVADADGGNTGPEGLQRGGQHGLEQEDDGVARGGRMGDTAGEQDPGFAGNGPRGESSGPNRGSGGGAARRGRSLADTGCGGVRDQGLPMERAQGGVQEEAREQRIRDDAGDGDKPHGRRRLRGEFGEFGEFGGSLGRGEGEDIIPEGKPGACEGGGLGDTSSERTQGDREDGEHSSGLRGAAGSPPPGWRGIFIPCADGKSRLVEPRVRPLAHGVSGRVGQLRAYGNAIVPQLAAAFVAAFTGTRR